MIDDFSFIGLFALVFFIWLAWWVKEKVEDVWPFGEEFFGKLMATILTRIVGGAFVIIIVVLFISVFETEVLGIGCVICVFFQYFLGGKKT